MSNFYCAAPWRGLHINPRGDVKTCCAGNPNMLGNLNEHSITEILNSESMKEIRRDLAQGQAHEYCSNCVQAERFGSKSERAWHNNVNADFDYSTAGELYHYPVIVDVRWNTTCNLSCNYCSPYASSKWANLLNIPYKSKIRPYYESVGNFIEQHTDKIHEVALVGGEPLLLPENDKMLDIIPSTAIVTLITNMSVDMENNKIFKKLANRNRVGWSMSFDNIGKRFEYVRYGSDWELLQKNLKLIKELMATQGHWGGIHAVYNLYNATHICEFKEFAKDIGISVVWQNLFDPQDLDPFLCGIEVAKLAKEEIDLCYTKNLVDDNEKAFFNQAREKYQSIIDNQEIGQSPKNYLTRIEDLYHTDKKGEFKKLWPELYNLIWQKV